MPGQHFLLSAAAKDLPLRRVFAMKEDQAFRIFRRARWPDTNGRVPWCPHCGCEGAYEMKPKPGASKLPNRFRCKQAECGKDFSVTSGTILANRKLSFKTLLAAVVLSVQSVKGKAALQLSRELGVQYKTAWVLSHKLREAVAAQRASMTLDGTVEMDGLYIGGHIRPANREEDRIDRRAPNPRRQCVMVLRQRRGRTLATVVPGEQRDPAWDLVRGHVRGPAELIADEAPGYDELVGLFPMVRNNHRQAYVVAPGASTNQAESFFSRLRRAENGIHHRISGVYLDWYVADLAYREDMRRKRMSGLMGLYVASALLHPVSRNISGYWQGNKPEHTLGWDGENLDHRGMARRGRPADANARPGA